MGTALRKDRLSLPRVGQSRLHYFEKVRGIERFIENIDGAFVDSFLSNFSIVVGRY